MRPGCGRIRCPAAGGIVAACAALAGLATAAAPSAGADAPPPRHWSPAVSAARAAYDDGRYDEALALLARVLADQPDFAARRDAELLQALCLLRQPDRNERLSGRALLAELGRAEPQLNDDPDCLLAYGLAQTALAETGSALDALARAADGFAAQHRPAARLAALEALAHAWAVHGEWFATPARFQVAPPPDPAAADAIRARQIEAVRAAAAAIPGSAATVAAIELTLAQHRLRQPETAEAGRALLESVAERSAFAETAAAAASALARLAEDEGRANAARRWYERAAELGAGRVRAEALERIAALSRPDLHIAALEPVGGHAAAPLPVTARGLEELQLEVRRVDLDAWLATPTQRGNEARLPESGSVAMTREFRLDGAAPTAWRSTELRPPLEFRGPPGAYAVIARGRTSEGREVTAKRLLIVTDLLGVACVSRAGGAVFALPRPGAAAPPDLTVLSGRFWMLPSFTPTEIRLDGGAGLFTLPPEAQIAREPRWLCLLRAGEHVALCRGELPDPTAAEADGAVFFAGPGQAAPGAAVAVAGWIAPTARGAPPPQPAPQPVLRIELVDTFERVVATAPVTLDAAGVFATELRVPSETLPQTVRVLLRSGGRSLENLAPPQTIRILAPGSAARLAGDLPVWSTPDRPAPRAAAVHALYPWGTPATLRGGQLRIRLHAPAAESDDAWMLPVGSVTRAFESRHREWLVDLSALDPTRWPHPLACGLELTGRLADGRSAWRLHGCAVASNSPPAALPPAEPPEPEPLPRSSVALRGRLHTDAGRPRVVLTAGSRDRQPVGVLLESGAFHRALVVPPEGASDLELPVPADVPAASLRLHAFLFDGDSLARIAPRAVDPPVRDRRGPAVAIEHEGWFGDARLHLIWEAGSEPADELTMLLRLADLPTERWRPAWDARRPDTLAVAASLPLVSRLAENDAAWPAALPTQCGRALAGPTAWCAAVPRPGRVRELSVTLPEARFTQTVALWLFSRHGCVGHARLAVPAVPGGAAWLDVPPRWTIGDRGRLTLGLARPAGSAVTARVTFEPGELLAVERVLYRTGLTGEWQAGDADGTVPLAADATTWVAVVGEAVRAGAGTVRATLELPGGGLRAWSGPYEVSAAPAAPTAPDALRMRRTIELWVPDDEDHPAPPLTLSNEEPSSDPAAPRWAADNPPGPRGEGTGPAPAPTRPLTADSPAGTAAAAPAGRWVAVAAGDHVPPERYLRIREEFELLRSDNVILWSQVLPLTCTSLATDPPECKPLGRRLPGPADRLEYRLPLLPPGLHRHEYVLLTTRPGSALLPPPQLRRGDTVLSVRVEPAEIRLTVRPP